MLQRDVQIHLMPQMESKYLQIIVRVQDHTRSKQNKLSLLENHSAQPSLNDSWLMIEMMMMMGATNIKGNIPERESIWSYKLP